MAPALRRAREGLGAQGARVREDVLCEFARHGITTNSVAPNFIDRPMLRQNTSSEYIEKRSKISVMGHPGQPEDVATAISYLRSIEAKHINGHTLSVNGGNYMN